MDKKYKRLPLVTIIIIMMIALWFQPFNFYYNSCNKETTNIDNVSIINLLKQTNKNNEHPRLMMKKNDIARIKNYIEDDKFINQQYRNLKKKADNIIKELPVRYDLTDGVRLLAVSRTALDRLQTLGLMYNITGDEKYSKRGWLELETICDLNPDRKNYKFSDWHPQHFLDTAEMTNAAAIGYDWLYNYLDEEQRIKVREAIYTKGMKEALKAYENKEPWTNTDNNWSAVCNSGIAMGALAIGDDGERYERDAGKLLKIAINRITLFLNEYSPNGGWFEGPNYWDYATTYCAYFISSLDSSLKTDYGIIKKSNFNKAGSFLIYITGPKGVFNYGDSVQWKIKTPVMVWLANKFKNGQYIWYYKKIASPTDASPLNIVWYNCKIVEEKPKQSDMYFPGIEVATMHTDVLDNNDLFLAVKAGKNGLSHGDLDLGTFVYDCQGQRWFDDLGIEDYNVNGYWDIGWDGQRWSYYKKRAEGHNTLVINSEKNKPDQNVKASTKIVSFLSGLDKSSTTLDLSDAYASKASSVTRTFTLLKKEKKVYIEDSIEGQSQLNINWNAHTTADVELSSDRRTAILKKNGKSIAISIKSPEGICFSVDKIADKDKFICNNISINFNMKGNTKILVEISQQ